MMNPVTNIALLSAILNASIGIYILILDPKKNTNRLFFLLVLSVVIFNIGEFLTRTASSEEIALLVGTVTFSVFWLGPPLALHFALIFPRKTIVKRYESLSKYLVAFTYIIGFVIYLIFINSVSIRNVQETEWGYLFPMTPSVIAIWFLVIGIFGMVIIVLRYKFIHENLYPNEKKQIKAILFGSILLFIIALLTKFLPPLFNMKIIPTTSLISFFFILIVAYAIVKYKFLYPSPELIAENILDTMSDLVLVLDKNEKIVTMNKSAMKILGYNKGELLNTSLNRIIDFSDPVKRGDEKILKSNFFKDLTDKNKLEDIEMNFINRSGKTIPMSISASIMYGSSHNLEGIVLVGRDLTEIKKSLKEKEVLLKEIHHRVKNNLQLISSLLYLQSDQIKNKKLTEIFEESQNRIKLMASFYEQLYQSEDVGEINFKEYIQNITTKLFHSYRKKSRSIDFRLDIDDISMDVNTTLICSFIISELVSNSLKHAFPNNRKGEIKIAFHENNNICGLEVCDTGVGIPKEVDIKNTKTLGLQLVNMFVQQLKGEIELDRTRGTKIKITFKNLKERVGDGN